MSPDDPTPAALPLTGRQVAALAELRARGERPEVLRVYDDGLAFVTYWTTNIMNQPVQRSGWMTPAGVMPR